MTSNPDEVNEAVKEWSRKLARESLRKTYMASLTAPSNKIKITLRAQRNQRPLDPYLEKLWAWIKRNWRAHRPGYDRMAGVHRTLRR